MNKKNKIRWYNIAISLVLKLAILIISITILSLDGANLSSQAAWSIALIIYFNVTMIDLKFAPSKTSDEELEL